VYCLLFLFSLLLIPSCLSYLADPYPPHSFPTRRSSDLQHVPPARQPVLPAPAQHRRARIPLWPPIRPLRVWRTVARAARGIRVRRTSGVRLRDPIVPLRGHWERVPTRHREPVR